MPDSSETIGGDISIPVYRVLVAELPYGDLATVPAAQAVIWRAIDRLQAAGRARRQIGILEGVSCELHLLRQKRGASSNAAHARLRALTHDWLECAPLLG